MNISCVLFLIPAQMYTGLGHIQKYIENKSDYFSQQGAAINPMEMSQGGAFEDTLLFYDKTEDIAKKILHNLAKNKEH